MDTSGPYIHVARVAVFFFIPGFFDMLTYFCPEFFPYTKSGPSSKLILARTPPLLPENHKK